MFDYISPDKFFISENFLSPSNGGGDFFQKSLGNPFPSN